MIHRASVCAALLLAACAAPEIALDPSRHDHATAWLATIEDRTASTAQPNAGTQSVAPRSEAAAGDSEDPIHSEDRALLALRPNWERHPELLRLSGRIAVASTEFDQARELAEWLRVSKAVRADRPVAPEPVAPHVDASRDRIAEAALSIAIEEGRFGRLKQFVSILDANTEVQALEEDLELHGEHVKLLDELLPVVASRVKTGRASQAEWLEARSARARHEADRMAIAARLEGARERLAERTQTWDRLPAIAWNPPEPVALSVGERRARAHAHPRGRAARATWERRFHALRLHERASAGPAVTMPPGVRGAVQTRLQREAGTARMREEAIVEELATAMASTSSSLQASRTRLQALENEVLPASRKALADLRASYAGRQSSFVAVFRAARTLLDDRRSIIEARRLWRRAGTAYLLAIGRSRP